MKASRAIINMGLFQGYVPFWTFFGSLWTISTPNHHVGQPNHHVLHPPSLFPLQKYQGPRNNGGIFSTPRTIVAGSIFVAGFNLRALDAHEATLCMAKKSKPNMNHQASGSKGGKRVKGGLVLDLSDPADPSTTLGECLLVWGRRRMVRFFN